MAFKFLKEASITSFEISSSQESENPFGDDSGPENAFDFSLVGKPTAESAEAKSPAEGAEEQSTAESAEAKSLAVKAEEKSTAEGAEEKSTAEGAEKSMAEGAVHESTAESAVQETTAESAVQESTVESAGSSEEKKPEHFVAVKLEAPEPPMKKAKGQLSDDSTTPIPKAASFGNETPLKVASNQKMGGVDTSEGSD